MRGPELVLISAVVAVALSLYVFFTGRHRERMSMIDKGVDANIFYSKKKNGISSTLKFGMLLVGVSVGILCLLHNSNIGQII